MYKWALIGAPSAGMRFPRHWATAVALGIIVALRVTPMSFLKDMSKACDATLTFIIPVLTANQIGATTICGPEPP
jgi:hypothetical protein